MPTAHIYPLSRLVHAQAGTWQNLLKEIEEGKSYASRYYLPVREAIVRLCATRGQNRTQILNGMTVQASAMGGPHNTQLVRANINAFNTFADVFLPRITRFRKSFLRDRLKSCDLEGLTIEGAPHLEVRDESGRIRHVFLHAADWRVDDLSAYLELLGIVIENCYGGDSSTLLVLDLRSGREIKWKSKARVRKRCENAANYMGGSFGRWGSNDMKLFTNISIPRYS